MSEELKPCPFCGGEPKTSHRPESEACGGGHVAFVVCYCGGYSSTAHQMGHAETVQAAIAEAIEKWNTRTQLASTGGLQTMVDQLAVIEKSIDARQARMDAREASTGGDAVAVVAWAARGISGNYGFVALDNAAAMEWAKTRNATVVPVFGHPAAASAGVVDEILELILAECRHWHGRDEARRGNFAILYAAAKELAEKKRPAGLVVPPGLLANFIEYSDVHKDGVREQWEFDKAALRALLNQAGGE